METKNNITDKTIPYIAFESALARFDRVIKRMWVIILILVFLLLGTNLAWLHYESQFEEVTETTTTQKVTQDTKDGGNNSFIGGDSYGEADSKNDKDGKKD